MAERIDTNNIIDQVSSPEYKINGDFRGKDIISVEQFDSNDVSVVLQRTAEFEQYRDEGRKDKYRGLLKGKVIAECFSEASTRTFLSFMRASKNLGADIDGIPGMMVYSSAIKGETWEDTIKTVECYDYDAIILRHFDDDSALRAAKVASVPIISGGSGKLEHPTQALLDLYTVLRETDRNIADLHIAFVGDLKYGRTVHSLSKLMGIMGNKQMSFVSPELIKMPTNLTQGLSDKGVSIYETEDIEEVLPYADILYVTRVQKERFADEELYCRVKDAYKITPELMQNAKDTAVLMHPLPRVDEIDIRVDNDPRAAYFRQIKNGLWVRMALLSLILPRT